MTDTEITRLRDFVYLDVERVKSLLAQLDRGILAEWTDTDSAGTTTGGRAGIKLPALAEAGAAKEYVSRNESTETRTLHDFVYNQTEQLLIDRNRVKRIPQDFAGLTLLSHDVRSRLSPVEYVVVDGRISLDDYAYMDMILENINDLLRISIGFSYEARLQAAIDQKERQKVLAEKTSEISDSKLDDKFLKDLRRLLGLFLKDRLVIKSYPLVEEPNFRIVGPLQRELLRDKLEDIRYKFGTSPSEKWTVFGQIAAIPSEEGRQTAPPHSYSNEIDAALNNIYSSLRDVEKFFQVNYPEIAITPIAIYRQ